jgi:hypothetical protein
MGENTERDRIYGDLTDVAGDRNDPVALVNHSNNGPGGLPLKAADHLIDELIVVVRAQYDNV